MAINDKNNLKLLTDYKPYIDEAKILEVWEKEAIYRFNKDSKKPIFSIDTPPPTISGKMHLGHAFSYTQQDIIARYKRMRGYNVFYPFGTDDNGLPTQRLIEKIKNVKAVEMGREKFRRLCIDTLNKELRPKYIKDWKRIGMSCDFSLFYTTIDDHCKRWSQWSFIQLYKKGREYRKDAPTIYCPNCKTAISQVECKDKIIESYFNYIKFKIDDQDVVIATTRPELLPSCVAVFYHPEDERYKGLKGKTALVPLFNFEVPIYEDKRVDPNKGSGIVMCCTFGDMTDIEWQKAYNLPIKMSIGKDGKMTEISGKYAGMTIKQAREAIIKDLKEKGLLVKQEKIKHTVNVHDKCGTEIEIIKSKQWFIKYLDLREEMLRWGEEINWYPKYMKNRYDNWVKGLQWDWCISRQIYFGVPFPVWYCADCGEIILADEDQLPVDPLIDEPPVKRCPKCGSTRFIPEKDVINTWATSSLTPQIAASLIPDMFDKLFPMSLRPQAHDIISFWLFNTVVKSRLHYNKNPWKDCMISGWALDPHGKKMSKSLGNIIEPTEIIKKYGADALRFWAAGSKLGEDLPFQEKDIITGKKTITKLLNASKFIIINLIKLGDDDCNYKNSINKVKESILTKSIDKTNLWILTKLAQVIKSSTESLDKYEYSKAKSLIEKFFWRDLCDNYLEIIKDRLWNPNNYNQKVIMVTKHTLYYILFSVLKLFAPIMPFVCDHIYLSYFKDKEKTKSVHLTEWPNVIEEFIDSENVIKYDIGIELLSSIRKFKSSLHKSLKTMIDAICVCDDKIKRELSEIIEEMRSVMRLNQVEVYNIEEFKKLNLNKLSDYIEIEVSRDKQLQDYLQSIRLFVRLAEVKSSKDK